MDHGAAVPKTIFMELDIAAMRGLGVGQVVGMVEVRLSTYPDGFSGGHGVFTLGPRQPRTSDRKQQCCSDKRKTPPKSVLECT